ncbi:hypothetical protein [Clostridium pasteurianum]|uniref:Uncharacterized protein n=1 Tax=Clostridium pasteurianum BC1 TaxID=86416 RepID=R4KB95_CLOPA|nr:hypothetical protein [Clostridium pasteurianum]AGK98951.1 hypothetical protein Clopa_4224 [Clostridium pasteurianum BC1]
MLNNNIVNYTYNSQNSAFLIQEDQIKEIKNDELINNIKSADGFVRYKKQDDIIFYVKYEIEEVTVDEKNNLLIFVHPSETNVPENSKDIDIDKFIFED